MTDLNALFQLLGGPEGDLLAGLDLNRLARRRVPPHSGRQRSHLQNAETGQADFVAILEMPHCRSDQIAQQRLSVLL